MLCTVNWKQSSKTFTYKYFKNDEVKNQNYKKNINDMISNRDT